MTPTNPADPIPGTPEALAARVREWTGNAIADLLAEAAKARTSLGEGKGLPADSHLVLADWLAAGAEAIRTAIDQDAILTPAEALLADAREGIASVLDTLAAGPPDLPGSVDLDNLPSLLTHLRKTAEKWQAKGAEIAAASKVGDQIYGYGQACKADGSYLATVVTRFQDGYGFEEAEPPAPDATWRDEILGEVLYWGAVAVAKLDGKAYNAVHWLSQRLGNRPFPERDDRFGTD